MKFLAVFLVLASLASAADKRYSVCLVSGSDEACTKPLTKEAAYAVLDVFSKAPIGGLDAVYLYDTKSKNKKTRAVPAQQLPPLPHPIEDGLSDHASRL